MKHIVGFSGGIDSQAVALWVRNRYPKEDVILTNSNAGEWEHWLTEQFIDSYSDSVHPVTRCNAIVADMWKTPGFAETNAAIFAWDDFFDCDLICPIADWTKQMCFDYVKAHGEAINPLYALGFNRVGCSPCINSGREEILNWAARFPEVIDRVSALERSTGRTFFAPMVPGLYMNNIEQVLDWARCSYGGRQSMFPILHEREGCESKYGLCE